MANRAYRIHIVADDAEVRAQVRSLVEAHGHTATDSTAAEAAARAPTEPRPDVILLATTEHQWDYWNAALQTPWWRTAVVIQLAESRRARLLPVTETLYLPIAPLILMDVITRSSCKADLLPEEECAKLQRIELLTDLLRLVRDTSQLDGALVARVTAREWLCCSLSKSDELPLSVGERLMVEGSASVDMKVSRSPIADRADNPEVNHRPHPLRRRFPRGVLLAAPIVLPSGEFYGELCAVDSQPKPSSDYTIRTMSFLASVLASELGVQQDNVLRERFINKFAHDLRTPLSTITAGADILTHRALPETETRVVQRIERGASRMASLIETSLESTRARIGEKPPQDRGDLR